MDPFIAMTLAITVAFVPIIASDYKNPWAWGTTFDKILNFGTINKQLRGGYSLLVKEK
jgi:hypothetical protein